MQKDEIPALHYSEHCRVFSNALSDAVYSQHRIVTGAYEIYAPTPRQLIADEGVDTIKDTIEHLARTC